MPKKGLMAIPGMISASGSDGLGLMQIPPVSENTAHNEAEWKDAARGFFTCHWKRSNRKSVSLFFFYFTDFPESVWGAINNINLKIIAKGSYQLDLGSCRALKMWTFNGLMEFKMNKINFSWEIIAFNWADSMILHRLSRWERYVRFRCVTAIKRELSKTKILKIGLLTLVQAMDRGHHRSV